VWERHHFIGLLAVAMLAVAVQPALAAAQKADPKKGDPKKVDPKKPVIVAGIMFDHDRKNNWMTVKADGEDTPARYLIDPANQELAESLKSVFNANRVRVAYKAEGDSRRMVAIERQVIQAEGTITGTVVKVHNDFWIELKPRKGVANAFAPGANYNDQAFMAKLKSLKPGDSVTIQYNTDFERHRILAMRKNPTPASSKAEPKAAAKEKK
jgi:hypothetical protein